MRITTLALFLLVGCTPADEPNADTADSSPRSVETDTAVGECRDEAESCIAYDDGTSNCCNSRHTCFPEGCFYTEPE
jgi:hypothetical protein